MSHVIGVDIGGTFTDCVILHEDGMLTVAKSPSTPSDYVLGVVGAVEAAARKAGMEGTRQALSEAAVFLHACTIGDNTLLSDGEEKVALIMTMGFRDTLSMMRGLGPAPSGADLVAPSMVMEVEERIDSSGSVITPMEEEDVARVLSRVVEQGATAIAVCLLWSVLNDAHELMIHKVAGRICPEVPVLLSSRVAPYVGEYERTATTVIAAHVAPRLGGYLRRLAGRLSALGLASEPLIMQAHGGCIGIADAVENPVGVIESGPAAGVLGCASLATMISESSAIVADMGGTTFKVGIVDQGRVARVRQPEFMGHTLLAEKIRVESIGAGGGSIAWVDGEAGRMKVGPQGAGADPGPACYGLGGDRPTVTDADLVLGHLGEESLLGGAIPLHRSLAEAALSEHVGRAMGLDATECAQGASRIVNAQMADLIRRVTVGQGLDPREFVLIAVGGAAPMHAAQLCRELGVKRFIVPAVASVAGAFGLVMSDIRLAFTQAVSMQFPIEVDALKSMFSTLQRDALTGMTKYGIDLDSITERRSVDIKYNFQANQLSIPLDDLGAEISSDALAERFETLYEQIFGPGSTYSNAPMALVSARLEVDGRLPRAEVRGGHGGGERVQDDGFPGSSRGRPAWFDGDGWLEAVKVLRLNALETGRQVRGPAILEDDVTTIVVDPECVAWKDGLANIVVDLP